MLALAMLSMPFNRSVYVPCPGFGKISMLAFSTISTVSSEAIRHVNLVTVNDRTEENAHPLEAFTVTDPTEVPKFTAILLVPCPLAMLAPVGTVQT